MAGPRFAHLTGRVMWARCDHEGTRIDGDPPAVRLAPTDATSTGDRTGTVDLNPWRAVMGSAIVLSCAPDQCADATVLLVAPRSGLLALTPASWIPLPRPTPTRPPGDGLSFAVEGPQSPPTVPTGLALDPWGRIWLLNRSPGIVQLLAADLRVEASLGLPAGFDPLALGCAAFGLVVADGAHARLLVQSWGGEWRGFEVPDVGPAAGIIALAADPSLPIAAALVRDGDSTGLLLIDRTGVKLRPLPLVRAPLHLLWADADTLLVGEVSGLPGDSRPFFFRAFRIEPDGPEAEEGYAVRGFDGRALWREGDRLLASTAKGARVLYPREKVLAASGRVETWALDSGIFACVWHRLFLDLCLPADAAVTLEAKTSDDLPPLPLRRAPRAPVDRAGASPPPAADDPWPPLGSLMPDERDGWVPLGVGDRREGQADVPLSPRGIQRPSDDPLAAYRSPVPSPPETMQTLEYLITAPPGRYLWLRVRLRGTARRGPMLYALRASFPRPSLLDYLPAYWRADPDGGETTERALALFESLTTELDQRTDALVHLFDAGLAPAQGLPWLGSFLALTFDDRIDEPVRRQLLSEIAVLYRQRGTVPGLARLLSILARAQVQIVEGFRLRRPTAAFLGNGAVGPGLELGGGEGAFGLADSEPWEVSLAVGHAALELRRGADPDPCPPLLASEPKPEPPSDPLPADPLLAFYRRHAHRFTVIVPLPCDSELEAVLDLAIQTNKPAHTIHRLCWVDTGYRIGRSSMVGISMLGNTVRAAPAVLGGATLSTFTTLHRGGHDDRYRLFHPKDNGGTAQ